MKLSLLLVAVLACAYVASASKDDHLDDGSHDEHWEQHVKLHGAKFHNHRHQKASKLQFIKSKKHIEHHNKAGKHFKMKLNKLSHLTPEELKAKKGLKKFKSKKHRRDLQTDTDEHGYNYQTLYSTAGFVAPDSYDAETVWKTPVRNQGQCGSCWAFATVASIEAAAKFQKNQNVPVLSPQQLIDCAGNFDNDGCDGGLPPNGYDYITNNPSGAIVPESVYKYKEMDGKCKTPSTATRVNVASYILTDPTSEAALIEALVTKGPLAVGLDVSPDTFQNYASGVWDGVGSDGQQCSRDEADHAMLLVGYGTLNGVPYFRIKNQWGTDWGDNGYINVLRDGNGMCAITSMASIPIIQ